MAFDVSILNSENSQDTHDVILKLDRPKKIRIEG
jgi:hypothetical protein